MFFKDDINIGLNTPFLNPPAPFEPTSQVQTDHASASDDRGIPVEADLVTMGAAVEVITDATRGDADAEGKSETIEEKESTWGLFWGLLAKPAKDRTRELWEQTLTPPPEAVQWVRWSEREQCVSYSGYNDGDPEEMVIADIATTWVVKHVHEDDCRRLPPLDFSQASFGPPSGQTTDPNNMSSSFETGEIDMELDSQREHDNLEEIIDSSVSYDLSA